MSELNFLQSTAVPDFRDVKTPEDVKERFYKSAKIIMQEYDLKRGDWCWQITALELYLFHREIWPDPTTHGDKFKGVREQLKSGTWYVHRDGKLPPKRLGIDITAGDSDSELHAGLLVAAIGDLDGSGRAVRTIVRGDPHIGSWSYATEEKTLVDNIHMTDIFSDAPNLRLERRSQPRSGNLWVGARKFDARLKSKTPDLYVSYPLRIATWRTNPAMQYLSGY
jgi:hypothetical protein